MGLKIERKILQAQKNLEAIKSGSVDVGWFSDGEKKQKSNLTYPQLAAILSYGARLPGGQPYFFDKKGNLVFMKKNPDGTKPKGAMGITKPSYIPPRPMLEYASKAFGSKWVESSRAIAKNIIAGKITVEQGLAQLGALIKADIQDIMGNGDFTPNSPLTAKRKGKNTPLIDTGELRKAVDFKVNGK